MKLQNLDYKFKRASSDLSQLRSVVQNGSNDEEYGKQNGEYFSPVDWDHVAGFLVACFPLGVPGLRAGEYPVHF